MARPAPRQHLESFIIARPWRAHYKFGMTLRFWNAVLHRTLLFGGGWLVLTDAAAEAALPGAAVVASAVWLSLKLLPARHPLVLWRLSLHLPRFIAGSIRGGVDVARRAFSPAMPLSPGWVELPSNLSEGARATLGGEISLMPGTLAAGAEQGNLLVHLLDTKAGFDTGIAREEADIAAILGQPERASGK